VYGAGGSYYDATGVSQQPNITVIYPPQQAPVIVNQMAPPADAAPEPERETFRVYQAPVSPRPEAPAPSQEPARYLIAFKDHTIYSAVAYWVDGDTLHYFTNGSTHNQVSLTLVDRQLTERLNRETGSELKLPK
jgi:endonuclease YncB( thermonuclease family)